MLCGVGRLGRSPDLPCSAGHTACYISAFGVLSLRTIPPVLWQCATAALPQHWALLGTTERSAISPLEGPVGCSQCAHGSASTRCPGLTFMEGNMRRPSTADGEKSVAGPALPRLIRRPTKIRPRRRVLLQIQLAPAITGNRLSRLGAPCQCSSLIASATPVRSSRILV